MIGFSNMAVEGTLANMLPLGLADGLREYYMVRDPGSSSEVFFTVNFESSC